MTQPQLYIVDSSGGGENEESKRRNGITKVTRSDGKVVDDKVPPGYNPGTYAGHDAKRWKQWTENAKLLTEGIPAEGIPAVGEFIPAVGDDDATRRKAVAKAFDRIGKQMVSGGATDE